MKKIIATILILVLALSLVACDSSDYEKAGELYKQGKYKEAADIYEELGDYEDSRDKAIDSKYMYAESLYEEGSYEESLKIFESLKDYKESKQKAEDAKQQIMYTTYADVFKCLTEGLWFYESTSANAVNRLVFEQESVSMGGIFYDGNGPHENTATKCNYVVNDTAIIITLADETTMEIPYTLKDGAFVLGSGEYFTPEQVDAGLQGFWGLKTTTYNPITGFNQAEYIYKFEPGKITYEHANPAYGYSNGTYYYYGPYTATYKITQKGLEVDDQFNSPEFGFLIKEGKVVFSRYDKVFSTYSGFKGEDGFSF